MRPGYSFQSDPHPLSRLRAERGVSLRELAARAGLSYTAISAIEHGRVDEPKRATKDRIADALGVSAWDIWQEDMPRFQLHPDDDPDVRDVRAFSGGDAVIYLDQARVDHLDAKGRVVATETPARLRITAAHITIQAPARQGPRARGRRAATRRKAASPASGDDPAEPAPPARRWAQ